MYDCSFRKGSESLFFTFMMLTEIIVSLLVISLVKEVHELPICSTQNFKLLSQLPLAHLSDIIRSTFSISPSSSRVCFDPSAPGKDSSPEDDGKTIDSSLGFLWWGWILLLI